MGLFYCLILSEGILLVEQLAPPPTGHKCTYLMEKLRSQVVNKFCSTVHKFEAFISKDLVTSDGLLVLQCISWSQKEEWVEGAWASFTV